MNDNSLPRLYVHRLIVEGSYELDLTFKDVSLIKGPNKSGKSVLCNLLYFAWTGSTVFIDGVEELSDAIIYLEVSIGTNRYVLRRAIYQAGFVALFHSVTLEEYYSLRVRLPDDTLNQEAFGEFVLKQLGFDSGGTRRSIRYHTGRPFDFGQLYSFCYADQYTPPQDIFANGRKQSDSYIYQVMTRLIGVESEHVSQIQRELAALEQEKRNLSIAQTAINRFLEDSAGLSAEGLMARRTDLEKRREQLLTEQQEVDSHVRGNMPQYPEQVTIFEARRDLDGVTSAIQEANQDLVDLTLLENETIAEMEKLDRTAIPSSFQSLNITVCPHCLQPLSADKQGHRHCFICHQSLPAEGGELTTIFRKLLRDAGDRLVDLRAEKLRTLTRIAVLEKGASDLQEHLSQAVSALDHKTRSFVAPLAERLKEVSRNLALVDAELREVERLNDILKQASEYRKRLGVIRSRIRELDAIKEQREAEGEYKRRFETAVTSLYRAYGSLIDPQLVPQLRSLGIDEETLLPVVNGRTFRDEMTASDLPVLRGAVYYGLLSVSTTLSHAKFPRFLVIDTPKDKGIDEPRYMELLRRFLTLATRSATQCQFILTSGELPPEFDNPSFVLRSLEASDNGRLLRKATT